MSNEKEYVFDFIATIGGYGIVIASNEEEALEKIKNEEYDDIIDTWDMQIKEVTKIEEQ
jgi:hypothetical protein